MAHHLVVREPFGDFRRGDRITDEAEVARYAASHPGHHVRVSVEDDGGADDSEGSAGA